MSISPRLPGGWESLAFWMRFCGRQLWVELGQDQERYTLDEGEPLVLTIRGEPYRLAAGGAPVVRHG